MGRGAADPHELLFWERRAYCIVPDAVTRYGAEKKKSFDHEIIRLVLCWHSVHGKFTR